MNQASKLPRLGLLHLGYVVVVRVQGQLVFVIVILILVV